MLAIYSQQFHSALLFMFGILSIAFAVWNLSTTVAVGRHGKLFLLTTLIHHLIGLSTGIVYIHTLDKLLVGHPNLLVGYN